MNFIDDRVIMETEFFATTCRAYYGEFTFLEAYQRTGRCVFPVPQTPPPLRALEALSVQCAQHASAPPPAPL
jgi:hypothetical protein